MLRSAAFRIAKTFGILPLAVKGFIRFELTRQAQRKGLRLRILPQGTLAVAERPRAGGMGREIRIAARHLPYAPDIVGNFDYWHGAVEPTLVDGVAVVDYSTERLHVQRPSGDVLRYTGFAEPEETTRIYLGHAALAPGDLVLDFGAYCGGATLAFARSVGAGGHVVAFEPDPANASVLRRNMLRHAVSNVTVIEAGIWSESTELSFVAEGNMGSAIAQLLPRAVASHVVPVLSLRDAVSRACEVSRLETVAFLKFDIEGAELAVLKAGAELLRTHRPRLVIEPHNIRQADGSVRLNRDDVIAELSRLDYRCDLAAQGSLILATPR